MMAKEVKMVDPQAAFVDVDGEAVRTEKREDGAKMFSVFVPVLAGHEYVIDIRKHVRNLESMSRWNA